MAFQVLLNVILAIIWVLLQNSFTLIDFFLGYIVGIFILLLLRGVVPLTSISGGFTQPLSLYCCLVKN